MATQSKPKRKSCLVIGITARVVLFLVILFTFNGILFQLGVTSYPPL